MDDHLSILDDLDHSIRNLTASHVPLGFDQWLNYVVGTGTKTESHLVVFFLDEKTEFFQFFLDDSSAFESS